MKSKSDKIKLVIIILELIILIGLSSYRIYEFVDKSKEEIKGNENNNSKEDEKDNISTEEQTRGKIKILVYQINIRREANETSEDIGDVLVDEIYDVLEIIDSDNYTWYKINKNGVIGYVANQKGENWIDYRYENIKVINIEDELIILSINNQQYEIPKINILPWEYVSGMGYPAIDSNHVLINEFDISNSDNISRLKIANQFLKYDNFDEIKKYVFNESYIDSKERIVYSVIPVKAFEEKYNYVFGRESEKFTVEDFSSEVSVIGGKVTFEYRQTITDDDTSVEYRDVYIVDETGGASYDHYDIQQEFFKANKSDTNTIELYFYSYLTARESTLKKGNEIYSLKGDVIYENLEEVDISEENNKQRIEQLKEEGKIPIYKFTYKKQSDGNYYFTKGEWIN